MSLFSFNWTSTSWLLYIGLAVLAFVIFMLFAMIRKQQQQAAIMPATNNAPSMSGFNFGMAPAPLRASPSLAPRANPKDVQEHLETISRILMLEGMVEPAILFGHLAAGDESEVHRSIREIGLRFSDPRGVTQMARGVVVRHLRELKDDPEIKALISNLAT